MLVSCCIILAFEEIRDAYEEQIEALVDGGVDVIFIETIFDTLNAKAAVFAYESYFKRTEKEKLPLFVSVKDYAIDLRDYCRRKWENSIRPDH